MKPDKMKALNFENIINSIVLELETEAAVYLLKKLVTAQGFSEQNKQYIYFKIEELEGELEDRK